ncbi:MAG: transcriptional activator, partial [Chthonomonadales bacterium]|nr:transcriptional activator [Chthonomonadales bacterium]
MEPLWRIELLGALKITGSAGTFARLRTRKTGSLPAYLAYYSGRCHTRETLAEMFWPYSEPAAARLNLRAELSFLRRHLEPAAIARGTVLEADPLSLRLNADVVQIDVRVFEQTLQAAGRMGERSDKLRLLRHGVEQYRAG